MNKEKYIQLNIFEKQKFIKIIKDKFEKCLAKNLNLVRVSAPIIVTQESGLQDDLSGTERKVEFDLLKDGAKVQIVQSLAKWKRFALHKYIFPVGNGIYTDMTAIRRDESMDFIHSVYVDQWDWEKIITKKQRNVETLKLAVNQIMKSIKETSVYLKQKTCISFPYIKKTVYFITSEELLKKYPNLSTNEREYEITKKYKTVFVIGIGNKLSNGISHDSRAPDYDDWSLNGDLLVYHDVLDIALEISSMGVRVDRDVMLAQLQKSNKLDRISLLYHQDIINDKLPYTIGGGIGQSRLCMLLMGRAHIGEVQSSYWDADNLQKCKKNKIELL